MNTLIDYRDLIKVSGVLSLTDCSNLNVALLDTGIFFDHPDFNSDKIIIPKIYNSKSEIIDNIGHGTHMAGLLCADCKGKTGVIGLAPKATLTIFKVVDDNGVSNITKIQTALDYILAHNSDFDLVNMSFDIIYDEFMRISDSIDKIKESGIIMLASAGDDDFLTDKMNFPAYSRSIFSVGAIKNQFLQLYQKNGFFQNVDFFYSNTKLTSTFLSPKLYTDMENCSPFTALSSGLVLNIIQNSKKQKNERFEFLQNYLHQLAYSFQELTSLDTNTLYKTN